MKRKWLLFTFSCLLAVPLWLSTLGDASGSVSDAQTWKENSSRAEQIGPPWLVQPGWNYRRPVTISNNSATTLPTYQVLVRLDNSNFDFNLAKADGSDLRFTMFEGTILIPYWIESWDSQSQLAYVWVKVPYLVPGDTKIYLYHNNPNASPASDGDSTFDGFEDDWEQFSAEGLSKNELVKAGIPDSILAPFEWEIIEGTPDVSPAGYLILGNGTGIRSTTTFSKQAVGFKANFGPGSGNEWIGFYDEDGVKRMMIGDRQTDPTNLYLRNYDTVEVTSLIPRLGGVDWHGQDHIYEARWCYQSINCDTTKSSADVDHGSMGTTLSAQVPVSSTQLPVTMHNNNSGTASTLQVDWIYVRQYSNYGNLEPIATLGEQQGLVELAIDIADAPDPLPKGEALTYQITISNTAEIDAPSVTVTDTLPTNVLLGEVSTSQGSCSIDQSIVCDLNTILANSEASITVVVTPTLDGMITNISEVASPGYELNLSDNSEEEITLVDSVPPVLNWERPVHNGGTYISFGGAVLMEASATDNDQVAWVEFILWDHVGNSYVSQGTDETYPYQVELDSSVLMVDEVYQLFVRGSDRAGNRSDPFNPLQRIYIERRNGVFLPLMVK